MNDWDSKKVYYISLSDSVSDLFNDIEDLF